MGKSNINKTNITKTMGKGKEALTRPLKDKVTLTKLKVDSINKPGTVLNQFYSGWNNPSGNQSEVKLRARIFFQQGGPDYNADPFSQILFDIMDNNIFTNPATSSEKNLSRIESVSVYALPVFRNVLSDGVAGSVVAVLYGLPAFVGGKGLTVAQRSTILTPTSVSDWVYVGGFSHDKTFSDGNVQPQVNSSNCQVVGQVAIIDPDTGNPIVNTADDFISIQYYVDITYTQTLPTYTDVQGTIPVLNNSSGWDDINAAAPGNLPAMVSVLDFSHDRS